MRNLELVRTKPDKMSYQYDPNVVLDTVAHDCKVYCFVIGRSDIADDLKNDLKKLGEEYEKNLYVGLWNMGDPNYDVLAREYGLRKIPSIVMTALDTLSDNGENQYSFLRLDGRLLENEFINETKAFIRELYNLFIKGEIKEALKNAKIKKVKVFLVDLAKKLGKFSEKFLTLLGSIGLTLEYGGAKLILGKDSGEEDDKDDTKK